MNYLVAPYEPTNWRFPHADFARVLLERWPQARVQPPLPRDPATTYKIPMGEGEIFGYMLDNEQTFAFEDDIENVAEFAVWLRSVIPASVPLLFFSESGMCNVRLTEGTTKDELVKAIMEDRRDLGP